MEWYYGVSFAVVLYVVLVYVSISVTREKLNIYSGLLGTGIATIIWGFFWNNFLLLKLARDQVNWSDQWIFAALCIASLMIGIAGIIMVVVDIFRELR